ncbi:DinB family protein [Arcicella rigui]|uniref:DinB family protein n=1 Tax=Arcicella rigui TaxID=797020 RepID=A0ABU5QCC5_9BACT|nr:DinB family protein [Arcicella rigui]MEA5140509.1 DinB family protein [Arcicella rigui]
MKKPIENEFPKDKYFSFYIEQIDFQNVIEALMVQKELVINLYKNLSNEQQIYQYAPDKWTPQQILGHITDTERIFGYRALCIARGEKQALPGFDENEYMDASHFNEQSFESLLEQYRLVRESSIALFSSFSEEVASRIGNANGHAVSARALVWMIAGHERHHLNVLKERYNIG